MKAVTIHEAKSNLSKYIAAAKRGETIYIGSFGNAEVMLTAMRGPNAGKRTFGLAKGKIKVAPDAFSDQTDQQIAASLLGSPDKEA